MKRKDKNKEQKFKKFVLCSCPFPFVPVLHELSVNFRFNASRLKEPEQYHPAKKNSHPFRWLPIIQTSILFIIIVYNIHYFISIPSID
jgi:hypothetical protein